MRFVWSRFPFPAANGVGRRLCEDRVPAFDFDGLHRPVRPYKGVDLHYSLKSHVAREWRILRGCSQNQLASRRRLLAQGAVLEDQEKTES